MLTTRTLAKDLANYKEKRGSTSDLKRENIFRRRENNSGWEEKDLFRGGGSIFEEKGRCMC